MSLDSMDKEIAAVEALWRASFPASPRAIRRLRWAVDQELAAEARRSVDFTWGVAAAVLLGLHLAMVGAWASSSAIAVAFLPNSDATAELAHRQFVWRAEIEELLH